jgi:tRNA(Arg) A34 adenosine deaminase TadA
MIYRQVHLTLPAWIESMSLENQKFVDDRAKIRLAIELSRLNVEHASGGPFGAAIFAGDGGLIAIGVNRVVPHHCSVAHAEMMAFMTAQQRVAHFRINQAVANVTLATSSQPCAMCFGASIWAGIDRMLIAARAEDVERLAGFDEGPLPADWATELHKRGIALERDLERDQAIDVLKRYGEQMGTRY